MHHARCGMFPLGGAAWSLAGTRALCPPWPTRPRNPGPGCLSLPAAQPTLTECLLWARPIARMGGRIQPERSSPVVRAQPQRPQCQPARNQAQQGRRHHLLGAAGVGGPGWPLGVCVCPRAGNLSVLQQILAKWKKDYSFPHERQDEALPKTKISLSREEFFIFMEWVTVPFSRGSS